MRVLHVSPYFAPAYRYGGPIESVYKLCHEVARAGCEVRVLTTNADGPRKVLDVLTNRKYVVAAGLDVMYCRRRLRRTASTQMLRYLLPYVRWADVVHLTAVYSFPTIPLLMACQLMGKPLVWSPRGAFQRWRGSRRNAAKWIWELACKAMVPTATILHVTSEEERAESLKRMPGLRAAVIPNGVVIPSKVRHSPGAGTLRLGYIGRLDPKKGIENLFAACRLLRDAGMTLKLAVAGGGGERYTAALKSKVDALSLGAVVTMLGHVSGAAKASFFRDIDLLVAPSFTENFCIAVAEALAHGVPVVASKGTPWQRVEESGCGLWVDNDPRSLAAAVERMNCGGLAEMGGKGREWMAAEFSWQRIAREMCNCYSELVYGGPIFRQDSSQALAHNASA
ncbi:MAG: glycosyltransferase [Candidatus Binataceae bacterium]